MGGFRFFKSVAPMQFTELLGHENPLRGVGKLVPDPNPTLTDIDGDGDLDLFAGAGDGKVHFFRNDGNETHPLFGEEIIGTGNPLNEHIFRDIGKRSWPSFLGNRAYVGASNTVFDEPILVYQHLPTLGTASYVELVDELCPFTQPNWEFPVPAFVDIDGDGDLDCFVGEKTGTVRYFENIGNATAPNFVLAPETHAATKIDVGRHSAITFGDLNGDQVADMVVGNGNGDLLYYENLGTAKEPRFETFKISVFEGLPKIEFKLKPQLVDWDEDGLLDLVLHYEQIRLARNVGNATHPSFALTDVDPFLTIDHTDSNQAVLVDLDGDGDLDLVLALTRSPNLIFHENVGNGTFSKIESNTMGFPLPTITRSFFAPTTVAFANLSGSELANDLVVAGASGIMFDYVPTYTPGNRFPVHYNELVKNGPFPPFFVLHFPRFTFLDVNGDGFVDILCLTRTEFSVIINDGKGNFHMSANSEWDSPLLQVPARDIDCAPLLGSDARDCLVMNDNGTLHLFRNDGNAGADGFPIFTEVNLIVPVTLSQLSSVNLFDIDGEPGLEIFLRVNDHNFAVYKLQNFELVPVSIDFPGLSKYYAVACVKDDGIHYGSTLCAFVDNLGEKSAYRSVGKTSNFVEITDTGGVDAHQFKSVFQRTKVASGWDMNVEDLDGDGDLDLIVVGHFDNAYVPRFRFFQNTARECSSQCNGRGTCAASDASPSTLSIAATQNGVLNPLRYSSAAGMCNCDSNTWGDSCEQCQPSFYGVNCDSRCPEHSETRLERGESIFPRGPSLGQCKCNPSFVRVEDGLGAFSCTCAKGFGYDQDSQTCVRCDLGFFKSTVGLEQCTSCGDDRSTTTITGATDENACVCEPQFELINGRCGCPSGESFNNATGTCQRPNLSTEVQLAIGSLAGLLGSVFLVFLGYNREHLICKTTRLPWGLDSHFFISYRQLSGSTQAHALAALLQRKGLTIWIDKHQKEVTTQTMTKGVSMAAVYVLVLTPGVFESEAVWKEFATAVKLDKPIVLVHVEDFKFAIPTRAPGVSNAIQVLFETEHSIPLNQLPEAIENNKGLFRILRDRYQHREQFKLSYLQRALAAAKLNGYGSVLDVPEL